MKRLLALLSLALAPTLAQAAPDALARVDTEFVRAGLHAEDTVIAPGVPSRLALDMEIQTGWHTYWKNSGDSGQPVEIEWTLPDGVEIGAFDWPAPHRQPFEPMMNYGYSDHAIFTMPITVPANWPAGKPVDLKADVYWLVCEMVCIPERGEAEFSLPTGDSAILNDAAADLFMQAEETRPTASPYKARYQYDGTHLRLRFDGAGFDADTLQDAYFYPGEWGIIDHAATQVVTTDPTGLTIVIPKSTENEPELTGTLDGVLEIVESTGTDETLTLSLAVDSTEGIVNTGAAGFKGMAGTGMTLPVAIAFAFIGGLILNLMPCVFPVLALKAIGFAATAHESAGKRLTHGLAYTAGVLTLFVILAGVLIALKSAGAAVGWGFQLQNPLIVAGLAYLLLLVGLNLSGVFEFQTAAAGAGEGLTTGGGARGAYFTGALAAIVATPCTAPFMATALGAALTMSAPATMTIFIALGLGLAAPFLLLSVIPGVASRMPKPGMWMVRFKEFLAFPMYATAAWLLTVLATLAGPGSMLIALIGAVLVGLAAWSFGAAQDSGRRGQLLGYTTAVASLAAVVALSLQFTVTRPSADGATTIAGHAGPVVPYSTARLDTLLAEGKPVFVNMTADWCITCKVNEKMAFGEDFQNALADNDITYLVGDWTAYDPEITALLEKFGRVGVPLYAVFPRSGDPVLLPQILTSDRVVTALDAV